MLAHCHTKQFEQYHYQCVVFDVFVVYHFLLTVAMLKRDKLFPATLDNLKVRFTVLLPRNFFIHINNLVSFCLIYMIKEYSTKLGGMMKYYKACIIL